MRRLGFLTVLAVAVAISGVASAQDIDKSQMVNIGEPFDRPTGFILPGETCLGNGGTNCDGLIPTTGTSGTMTTSFDIASCTGDIIEDVNVGVDLTHTFVGDLEIRVTGPSGTTLLLQENVCSADDDEQAILDDEGTDGTIGDVCPIVAGSYVPAPELLASFDGEIGNGTWTMEITDDFAGDTGQLIDWSVELTCQAPVPAMPPYGLMALVAVLAVLSLGYLMRRRRARSELP